MDILSDDGRAALAAAEAEADPTSLGAAERLRRQFPADLAAQALSQVALRRKAVGKFEHASQMFFTTDGLQQATRRKVAAWRARLFAEAGSAEVWDLGCGIGADAMAFQTAGIRTQGVEADEATAAFATANLALVGGPPVIHARAEDVVVPGSAAVFLDPARRTARGRTWDVADLSPTWGFVEDHLAGPRFCSAKLGPGFPKNLIPHSVAACWVSDAGSVVELSLWNRLPPGAAAVVFGRAAADPVWVRPADQPRQLEVADIGDYLIEPDNAVIRAGLVAEIAPGQDVWLLASGIAYLSADAPLADPTLGDSFRVLHTLPFDVATLRRYVKQHRLGSLEIKCRGIDVDPAVLRRQLKPSGRGSATIILARTPAGAMAVVADRV